MSVTSNPEKNIRKQLKKKTRKIQIGYISMLISKLNIILCKQHIVQYFSFSHLSEQTNCIQISDRIFVPYRLNVPVLIVHYQCIIFQRKKFFFIIFHHNLCAVDMHAIAFAFVHTKKQPVCLSEASYTDELVITVPLNPYTNSTASQRARAH